MSTARGRSGVLAAEARRVLRPMSNDPMEELSRLEKRFESQAEIFPEDSQLRKVCEWAAEQVQEVIDEHE